MRKIFMSALVLVIGLGLAVGPTLFADDDDAATKERIVANLKLTYQQLRDAAIQVTEIKSSDLGDLQEGTFTINGQRAQRFLLTPDGKSLYLLAAGPINVGRSSQEIEAEMARLEAEELKKAEKNHEVLMAAISDLPYRGNPDAPVTIVEFSDFQCPYCARGAKTVDQILEKYGDDVKVVFSHYPLNFHPWAKPAAIAATCASRQDDDLFWMLHDKYFENQRSITPQNVIEKTKEYLADSEIDMAQWSTCAENKESEAYKSAASQVDGAMKTGSQLGVSGTPGFFVNGRFLNGAQPITAFEPLIEAAKKNAG